MTDPEEQGSSESIQQMALALAERDRQTVGAIEEALRRIESGRYGVCGACGERIPLVRLLALPFASFCRECQGARETSPGAGLPTNEAAPFEKDQAMRSKKRRSEHSGRPIDRPVQPTDEEIARRAHEIYLARGAGEGQALDDWLRAERELRLYAERRSVMATDPVCGMQIEETKAEGKIEHEGRTYYFCSQTCHKVFERMPQRFVGKK